MSELKVTNEVCLSVQDQFEPFEKQANEWSEKAKQITVTNASQTDLMEKAKEARLSLVKVRTGVTKLHKELKEEYLRKGQVLDSIKRKLVGLIEPIESHLQEQEDFVEIQEQLRKKNLQIERRKIMADLIGGEQADFMQLGEMSQDVFDNMVTGYKAAKEQREKDEAERIRLKAEEDLRIQKEQEANKAEIERLRKVNEEQHNKFKAEQEERLRLEKEADKKFKQEEEIRKEREKNERRMKRAPDRVKLLSLAEHIELLPAPEGLKDEQAKAILANAQKLLSKVVKYITENAESL
jgi:hypothetical protein